MTTLQLRKKVHEYVDRVDDDVLEMLLAMLKVKVESDENNSLLSKSQQKEVVRRYERHVAGEGTVYTVEEAKVELQLRRKNRKKK